MKDYQHLSMAISLIWKLFLKILHVIIKISERVIVCVRFLEILGQFFKKNVYQHVLLGKVQISPSDVLSNSCVVQDNS